MSIINLLIEDHEELRNIFNNYNNNVHAEFESLKKCLTLHTAVEERYLYPEAQSVLPVEIDHAKSEHQEAKDLLSKLDEDPMNIPCFEELKKGVLHHVEEEENDLFPKIQEALGEHKLNKLEESALTYKSELSRDYDKS